MPFRADGSSDKYELGGYDGSTFDKYNIDALITPDEVTAVFDKLSESPKFIPRTSHPNYPDDLCFFFLIMFFVSLFLFSFGSLTLAISSYEVFLFPLFLFFFLALACFGLCLIGTPRDQECLVRRQKAFEEILRELNNGELLA